MARGRPSKPRTTEIGLYLEQLRLGRGWNISNLASEAGVDSKVVSRLEVTGKTPRDRDFLLKIAHAFDIHPDTLYRKARLTPFLRPAAVASPAPPSRAPEDERSSHVIFATETEIEQLEIYLDFLRYISLSKAFPLEGRMDDK